MKPCRVCQKPFSEIAFRSRGAARPGQWATICRACESARGSRWQKENRERATHNARARRAADPAKAKRERRAHYEQNKERVLAQAAVYRAANKERERAARKAHYERNRARTAEVCRAYQRANKGKVAAWQKQYQTRKRQALPAWADLSKMAQIYETAAWLTEQSGELWHVDHIVPIQSKVVCGLHCEANLALLPASENISKSNRWWPDMFDPMSDGA